jgi:uncharacterized protein with GYD domain
MSEMPASESSVLHGLGFVCVPERQRALAPFAPTPSGVVCASSCQWDCAEVFVRGSVDAVGGHELSGDRFFCVSAPFHIPCELPAIPRRASIVVINRTEDRMPMFICALNWTDQGIRSVKDAPKRAQAARDLAKKVGVEIKEVYLTSGDDDLLMIVDTPSGDNVAKFALALGSQGNVRTRTARAWPQSEFQKLISELP